MREEYEFDKLKVKRRGMLPTLDRKSSKVRITIALDSDVVEHFKSEAAKPGALPYQTQINQVLRGVLEEHGGRSATAEALKDALLEDRDFVHSLARKVAAAG